MAPGVYESLIFREKRKGFVFVSLLCVFFFFKSIIFEREIIMLHILSSSLYVYLYRFPSIDKFHISLSPDLCVCVLI